jgi:hypothetical protein
MLINKIKQKLLPPRIFSYHGPDWPTDLQPSIYCAMKS